MRKILAILSMAFIIIVNIGCNKQTTNNNSFRDLDIQSETAKYEFDHSVSKFVAVDNIDNRYKLVTEGTKVALYCDFESNTIAVFDKCDGYLWNATVDKNTYNYKAMNLIWVDYMSSLLSIRAYKPSDEQMQIQKFNNANKKNITSVKMVNDKLVFKFEFTQQKISMELILGLKDNRLVVELPSKSIKEEGEYKIVSIEVMPFFGSASDDEKGYITIPDGSGSLMNYKPSEGQTNIAEANFSVYSQPNFDSSELNTRKNTNQYNLSLPLYGIKNEKNACLVICSNGMEDAELNVSPSGNIVPFNRALFKYNYRYTYNVQTSNIVVGDDNTLKVNGNSAKSMVTKLDEAIVQKDRKQEIIFLNGDNADYSGMANSYRNYLIENKLVNKNISSELPLSLNIFCGIQEKSLLLNNYINMTNFEQAGKIADTFADVGISQLIITLEGWSKGGYGEYISGWNPESRLGGEKDLISLANKLNEKKSQLFLKIDPLTVNKSNSVRKNEMMILGNNTPAIGSNGHVNYLEPYAAAKKLNLMSNNSARIKNIGLAVDYIGSLIYKNYNKSNIASRGQTMAVWEDSLKAIFNKQPIAIDTGNMYSLKSTDMVFNIPMQCSRYLLEDTEIPFLQMVLYGLIPFSSEPGNLSYDLNLQKLKWIEYGAIPNFEITYNKTQKLKNTSYNMLFTSTFERWFPSIKDITNEMRNNLNSIWGQYMVKHEILENNLIKTTYSNGDILYVNYNKTEKVVDGIIILPGDYKIIGNGVK